MTDDESPDSGWNPRVVPATDSLGSAGIRVTGLSRAVASNPSVLKQPAWGRGPAIRGVSAYVETMVNGQLGPNRPNG